MDDKNIFKSIPKTNYEEKAIETNTEEFIKVVKSRRSVRVFENEPIPDAIVHACLDLALTAPNSSNLQPWHFVRVKSPENKEKVTEYCMNQPAARTAQELIICIAELGTWKQNAKKMVTILKELPFPAPKSAFFYYEKIVHFAYTQGPLNILGLLKKIFIFFKRFSSPLPSGNNSKADMRVWAHKSTALACQNLMLAFRAYGYDSCPMEGFDKSKVRRLLKLNRKQEICMIISAGKRAPNGIYGPQIRFDRELFIREI